MLLVVLLADAALAADETAELTDAEAAEAAEEAEREADDAVGAAPAAPDATLLEAAAVEDADAPLTQLALLGKMMP